MSDRQIIESLDTLKSSLSDTLNGLQELVDELTIKIKNDVFEFLNTNKSMDVVYLLSEVEKKFSIPSKKAEAYTIEYIHSKKDCIVKPKNTGIRIWNSFVDMVREEMPSAKYEEVIKKARYMKQLDPESYRVFAENWTP